jgi:serine/threonine-protein kinase
VTPESSTTVASGDVIRQDPPAGEKVAKGTEVAVVISSGSPSPSPSPSPSGATVVPDVYGIDASMAASQLEAAGLLVAAVKEKGGTGQPPGTVVKVKPDVGTTVPVGSSVTLTIAA